MVEIGLPLDTTNFGFPLTSALPGAEDFSFELTSDAPADWSAYYTVNTSSFLQNDTLSLNGGVAANIGIHVTPGAKPFVATYTLTIRSVANPMAPPIIATVMVISNVTDLVLNNDAPWGDGLNTYTAKSFESNYMNGLTEAGNTHFASTPVKTFMAVAAAGKLSEVEHIYYNISWTFPSMDDQLVGVLGSFLDNGGNLLLAGQDAAWDNWDLTNGGNGTTVTQAFYTNYLHTAFVADGGATNTIMTPVNYDLVFGTLDTGTLVNPYGGAYFYPDQIDTVGPNSLPLFYYNSALARMGGLRYTAGTYKIVYLGVGIEMIADSNIRKNVIHIAHDWFHGLISGAEEYDNTMAGLFLGQNYPNPADGYTCITFSEATQGSAIEIFDMIGNRVFSSDLEKGSRMLRLQTADWNAGVYTYRLINPKGDVLSKKIIVTH